MLPHGGQGQHGLELRAITGTQGGEAQFARVSLEDDAAGNADSFTRGDIHIQIGVVSPHLGDRVGDGQAHGIWLVTRRNEAIALIPADTHLLRQIGIGLGSRLLRLRHRTQG